MGRQVGTILDEQQINRRPGDLLSRLDNGGTGQIFTVKAVNTVKNRSFGRG